MDVSSLINTVNQLFLLPFDMRFELLNRNHLLHVQKLHNTEGKKGNIIPYTVQEIENMYLANPKGLGIAIVHEKEKVIAVAYGKHEWEDLGESVLFGQDTLEIDIRDKNVLQEASHNKDLHRFFLFRNRKKNTFITWYPLKKIKMDTGAISSGFSRLETVLVQRKYRDGKFIHRMGQNIHFGEITIRALEYIFHTMQYGPLYQEKSYDIHSAAALMHGFKYGGFLVGLEGYWSPEDKQYHEYLIFVRPVHKELSDPKSLKNKSERSELFNILEKLGLVKLPRKILLEAIKRNYFLQEK